MPRSVEVSQSGLPAGPDQQGWRHFGDGIAGKIVAARLQGFNTANADYRDVAVDASGNLLAALTASAIEIGTVDQGTGGTSAWKMTADSLPLPTGAAKDSTLTDGTQRVGGTVGVTGTFWQVTQPVSGPLTDTQLRATAVPVSGTFWPGTQPVSGELTADIGTTGGLALDATFTAAVGQAGSSPAAYTVLDQLKQIRCVAEKQAKATQALVDAARPPARVQQPATLLHRR